jgi:hypothetical protein
MIPLMFAEFIVVSFVVIELGIPAIRGTKFFPMLRSLSFNRKLANVETQIDNEIIRQRAIKKEKTLKGLQDKNQEEEQVLKIPTITPVDPIPAPPPMSPPKPRKPRARKNPLA